MDIDKTSEDPRRDLVIGAVTGYKWDQIKYWVNSLDRSGFEGMKAVVAYNMDNETVNELTNRGYAVLCFERTPTGVVYPKKDFSIVVERFLHYYIMLHSEANAKVLRWVIATDVKDVVFQKNPSLVLDRRDVSCYNFLMSSEAITYQYEPWGANNLFQSFGPQMYEKHKDHAIVNCGVLAGKFDMFMGLSKTLYLMCANAVQHVPGGGGPDQAALNLLLDTPAYESITCVADHNDDWAAQLGTTMDPRKIQAYLPYITEPLPRLSPEGLVVNPANTPYTIVHQWDRVPEVKEAVERLYA